jgi:hypothetical protein
MCSRKELKLLLTVKNAEISCVDLKNVLKAKYRSHHQMDRAVLTIAQVEVTSQVL